jgi:hypothetical protein
LVSRYGMFDETLRSSEDWDYWLTIAYGGAKLCHMPVPLTLYRVRGSGLSGNPVVIYSTGLRVILKQKILNAGNSENMALLEKLSSKLELRLFAAKHFLSVSFVDLVYTKIKKWRFHRRFKPVNDPAAEEFVPL